MTAGYQDSNVTWQFREVDGTLPVYRPNDKGEAVSAGTFPNEKVFRAYQGEVSTPWDKELTLTPSSGYYAVELAPYIKGQYWAAYNVPKGFTLPSVASQLADTSSKSRRVWAKTTDINNNSLIIDPSDNAKAEAMGAHPTVGGGGGVGNGNGVGNGVGNGKGGGVVNGDSNWLWWVLAAGSAVAGAPIAVPIGLAAMGIVSAKKDKV